MSAELMVLLFLVFLVLIGVFFSFKSSQKTNANELKDVFTKLDAFSREVARIEYSVKEEIINNRKETNDALAASRMELSNSLKIFGAQLSDSIKTIGEIQKDQLSAFSKNLNTLTFTIEAKLKELNEGSIKTAKENRDEVRTTLDIVRHTMENKISELQVGNEKKLEEMRATVDEKLQKTLSERLGQSFEVVGKQLENVQKGLGEMQVLAQDVGGLKRVLSNVKMRGGFGEVQLRMLLENILAPEQFESNVKIKLGTTESVEFAIKFPNPDGDRSHVWLPIDAKFPRDVYETLQNAYDTNDPLQIENAQKSLELTIRKMARNICSKYIDPPNTTDFGILFLPFEGIYAEVVRKASLLEEIQRECKVVITGPTTLAVILNSLQMGFRTLAIQKRSSEVWQILGDVKKEFEAFGGLMGKAQNNIQTGLNQLDEVMGKRTRAIQRKLRTVEVLENGDNSLIIPEISDAELLDDDIEN
jgi:DNA recombination protein RmuC